MYATCSAGLPWNLLATAAALDAVVARVPGVERGESVTPWEASSAGVTPLKGQGADRPFGARTAAPKATATAPRSSATRLMHSVIRRPRRFCRAHRQGSFR